MTRRRLGGRFLILVLVVVLFTSAGCKREDNSVPDPELQDRIIATASLTDDPTKLAITWFPVPCETFQEVIVEPEEDFVNLRIKVVVDVVTCPPEGVPETIVDIGEPLGDRKIWDKAFADTVALTPLP